MQIKTAEFMAGSAQVEQFPPPNESEIAFAGRSNVGKSSLINTLVNRKALVKTSGTPGKTREINFFRINHQFRLVDLPGYGYAKVSKADQAAWQILMESYLAQRENLVAVVLIVDIRHEAQPLDLMLKQWLDRYGRKAIVVANKADKLNRQQISRQLALLGQAFRVKHPLAFSAQQGTGKQELWQAIQALMFANKP